MLKRFLATVGCGALLFVLLAAPSVIDDPPAPGGSDNQAGNAANVASEDTAKTASVEALGATCIVFAVSAATGKDSAIVVQVSQDNSKFFTAAQDGATNTLVKSGYASGDSLNNGPHTIVVTYVDSKTTIPFPYRFVRLKVYNTGPVPISGFRVTPTAIYAPGGASEFRNAYGYTW